MARIYSWNSFDLRTVNFFEQYSAADRRVLTPGTEFVLGGRFYDSYLTLGFGTGRDRTSIEFYGDGISADEFGAVIGGRVQAIYNWFISRADGEWYYSLAVDEIDISAIDLAVAQVTESTADDLALLDEMLAGNDFVSLSRDKDWMDGGSGNDTIRGNGGKDTLFGGDGDDRVTGGTGADILVGGAGNDELIGQRDGAADLFVFGAEDGTDVITNFENGRDRIEIESGASRFADLDIDRVGAGSAVRFAETTIYVSGIRPADLTAADFLFT